MPIDPTARIASTAVISPNAHIGAGVEIGDFSIVEDDVVIGDGCRLESHVVVKRWTTLGRENEISTGTALGTDPLDKTLDRTFDSRRSYLKIGDRNKIREHYTISRGTNLESATVIGDDNFIMTSGHIAHDSKIGSGNVICSCSLIAGFVEIGDRAFISGGIGVHQFTRIGDLAMIAGKVRVNRDVPPYLLYSGLYVTAVGVNSVGLRRAGIPREEISNIKQAYKLLFRSNLSIPEALDAVERDVGGEHSKRLVDFIRSSKRGISKRPKGPDEWEANRKWEELDESSS